MSRTPSITETLLGRTGNIRNNAQLRQTASQGVTVRTPVVPSAGNGTVRSNVNPQGTVRPTGNPAPPLEETAGLQDFTQAPQQLGLNWLLPLVILGGFVAAAKLKKKKKNVSKL